MSGLERRYVERVIATAREAGVDVPHEVLGLAFHLEHGGGSAFRIWREANPDVDLDQFEACCWGVAVYGWERCTCWEDVYDVDQTDPVLPVPDGSIQVRHARCGDCAFRRGSKERSDAWSEEELLGLPLAGEPFWCHDGMRRPRWYRHPLLGDVRASGDDWRPPEVAGVPFRRDGSPGLLCAGWAQEVRRQERAAANEEATA